jgi:hypothetical protein
LFNRFLFYSFSVMLMNSDLAAIIRGKWRHGRAKDLRRGSRSGRAFSPTSGAGKNGIDRKKTGIAGDEHVRDYPRKTP